MITRAACRGCHDDFYNGHNGPASRCWLARTGKMMTRYRIHYMTAPTQKGAYTKVRVPSRYHQVSAYVFDNSLPSFVKASDLNRAKRKPVARRATGEF